MDLQPEYRDDKLLYLSEVYLSDFSFSVFLFKVIFLFGYLITFLADKINYTFLYPIH